MKAAGVREDDPEYIKVHNLAAAISQQWRIQRIKAQQRQQQQELLARQHGQIQQQQQTVTNQQNGVHGINGKNYTALGRLMLTIIL